jgi:hypothetical protein
MSSEQLKLWSQLKWDLTFDEVHELAGRYPTTDELPPGTNLTTAPPPIGPPFHPTTCCSAPAHCFTRSCSKCSTCSGDWWAFARATTDQSMACASRRAARYWALREQPAYVFSWDHVTKGDWNPGCVQQQDLQPLDPGTNVSKNSCASHRNAQVGNTADHARDIPFWFLARPLLDSFCEGFAGAVRDDCPPSQMDPQALSLAKKMAHLWTSFARDGKPRLQNATRGSHGIAHGYWPRWDEHEQMVLHLATPREGGIRAQAMEKAKECVFWASWEDLDTA